MEVSGLWKDGDLDTATAEEQLLDTIPKAKESVRKCAVKKETDDCDRASVIYLCLKRKTFYPPMVMVA